MEKEAERKSMKTNREISNTGHKTRVEPTLFDFAEEEKNQATEIGKHNRKEIIFAEKADWKNENGEEIYFFIKKDEILNAISTGLSKNYDGNGHYNNADESFHGFLLAKEHRTIPLLQAIAHPNDKNINLLTDDERDEFNFIMRKINSEYKKAYEDKLEQERHDREANAGKNATNFVLEKLKTAGIEVVTNKDEFERILEREKNLQRIVGTLTQEEQKRYFTFNEADTTKFKFQVDEWNSDKSNVAKLVTVGKIPPVMKVLGFPDNPIEIQHSTLAKVMRPVPQGYQDEKQGHALTINDIYSIPEQLADPVMVFKSRTRNDSFVFFTERKDKNNHSILIPMAVNKRKGRIVINEITSMYGKDNEIDFVRKNIDEGNLIYVDKKRSTEWERSSHVQFVTQRLSNSNAYNTSVLTKERLVNFISADAQERKPVQKMSLASSEPTNIESLFVSKNKANLDSEIDKLTEKDVSLKDDFITISEKTPFIFKEFGLDDFPVNMYKQKLARAFFLKEQKFGERITHGHKGEFTSTTVKEVFKDLGNPRYIFNSKQNLSNPKDFYLIGVYDELDEQKNPMILSLHFNKNRKEVEANWITSIYGKRKNILVNDWTQKGYLVYMNDLEMEKASAEVVTLQMRVSKSANAYINNVKKKSDFVNDFDVAFSKNQESVYGFTYNGKIYLNPDFLNSNVAVHEYTHLWDEYTRRTNPELWQKGMNIFKNTRFFNEVKSDPNYADIANDDNLVLSEVHARICGEMAQKVLERIAKEDGEIKSIDVVEWNNEVAEYVKKELFPDREIFHQRYYTDGITEGQIDGDAIERFLTTPMTDLAKGLSLKTRDFETRFKNGDFTEVFERLSDINFKADMYKTMSKEEQEKEYEKLWNELFPDGEPKEIQEKRSDWQQRIKEYEDKLRLPETLEKTKAQAKKMPAETIKERLEQYEKDVYRFYPKTVAESAERNEAKFNDNILNTLGKQYSSYYDHWLNWNDVSVFNRTEPVSSIATDIRISVLENELKRREISIEKENKLMTKKEIIDYYVAHNNDRKMGRFDSYESMMTDWKDFVENLYMSDAITEKQRDSLTEPCTEKSFEKFNERFESNVKQKVTKEPKNDYDEISQQKLSLTKEELSIAESVIPNAEYNTMLEYAAGGEENDFYKQKIKNIAEAVKNAPKIYETDEQDEHKIILRYFSPIGTEAYITEIGDNGEAFGFQCLNGDWQNAEWGYVNINELKNIPMMEIDLYVQDGMTVERYLGKEYPEVFPEYAKLAKKTEQNVANEIVNEVKQNIETSQSLGKIKLVSEEEQLKDYGITAEAHVKYFVKSTAEFEQFADFEPITNLTGEEAVAKYKELQEKGVHCGIGINIDGDYVFDDKNGNGITVLVRNNDGKDTFNIYGDSFVKNLRESDQHSFDVLVAFDTLYRTAKTAGLDVENAPYIAEKENELFENLFSQNQIYDGYASKQATNYVLEKFKVAGIEVVTNKDEFERRFDEINGTDVFQAMTEKFVETEKTRISDERKTVPRATAEIKSAIKNALEKTAVPLAEVVYSRENYQQIFRDGIVQSPVETIKLGANQFVRLCPPDRNNLMGAIYETMTKPALVLEKETFDEKSEKFKPVHVYGKSFINKKDDHTRAVESIVIFRNGENIAASLHNRDISKFIDQIKTADDIIYIDNEVSRVAAFSIKAGDSHVVKETQEFLSSSGLKSLPSWNKFYNPEDVLSIKKLIDDGKVQGGIVEINENNFDKYFNIFNQNLKYKDNRNKIASDLFNYHVKPENKAEMKEWLENQGYEIKEKTRQFKISNGNVYGFTDGEKIYLNPDFLTSNVAVHEYTHLWDEYTRRTNPELWQKGMNIFKGTKFFTEIKSDPNYADIANDDNLVLSEVHARICGEMAEKILERIAKEDGEITRDKAIDWNDEVFEYVYDEFGFGRNSAFAKENGKSNGYVWSDYADFLVTPLKDLMNGKNISLRQNTEQKVELQSKIIDHKSREQKKSEKLFINEYEKEEKQSRPKFTIFNPITDEKVVELKDHVWTINGGKFFENEIEESLRADLIELFKQYDSGETEENLTLVGVKMYRNPDKDGKISLLVEFNSKNPENRWREDALFNALNEEGIEFIGMKVDFKPITKDESGTIEQYLTHLTQLSKKELNMKNDVSKKIENETVKNNVETAEIEKLYAEVNSNGGNDRGFQFGVKDFEHLKNIKRLLDDFEKNPPKHSELEELEKKERRYSKESKRLQKIYEKEHDKDALKGSQKNADYANFYHWQAEKLNEDIIKHPNKFDSIKTWYEKTYPTDKEIVEKMSGFTTFGQLEIDIKNGSFGNEAHSEKYGDYDSLVRERMFQKLAEMNNVAYDVVYDAWLHSGEENINQTINTNQLSKEKTIPVNTTEADKNATNYVLEKLKSAGIEVVTDEDEFNRILKSADRLQKMTEDLSEYEKLFEKANKEKQKTESISSEKKSLEEEREVLERKNYEEFVDFVKSTEKYWSGDAVRLLDNDLCTAHITDKYFNSISIAFDSKKSIMSAYYIKIDDYESLKKERLHYGFSFNDSSLLDSYKKNLKTYLEQKITIEQQNQNRMLGEIGQLKTELAKNSVDADSLASDFKKLDVSLRFNSNFEIESTKLGENVSVFPGSIGKSGLGIRHIIEERFKKDNLSQDEITALCGLILETVRNGEITRDSKNRCEFSKNGIIAIVRKDFDNEEQNWILTGFHYTGEDKQKNREATETIKTVIAKYSNSDGYSYFRSQVGAVIASLDSNISQNQDKSTIQKMVVSSEEPENIESLFVSKNEENLNSEIDKLTEKDINVWNDYINISSETPFIYKQFGLDNYPVNMYKQKLARALFVEKEKFGERRTHGHKGEFTSENVKDVFKDFGNPRYIFNSKHDLDNTDNFYLIGVYDELDEQGNPMMLSLHFDKNRKQVEANWVTSVYGKNKEVLLNDWVRKGYLVYKNDLEIEKASEEVVALYMRVSNLQKPSENNIKLKSDYVNDMDLLFAKQKENVYGFAYEGKIYLNPDFINSNVAVHEYTHLWDEYTRRTNPELWQKGMNIFKGTKFFTEIKSDPNYADIANDDNLVLSEVHARICGEMAEKILERIAKEDGEITRDKAIDWNDEVFEYVYDEFGFGRNSAFAKENGKSNGYVWSDYADFLVTPLKDLMNGKNISLRQNTEQKVELQSKTIDHKSREQKKSEKLFINEYEKEEKQKMSKPMPLDFAREEREINNAPFEIIKDEKFNRVNIRFNTKNKSSYFDEILKELKSNEWKYNPSKKQWYPTNLKNNPNEFAKKLLEKYSESKEKQEIKNEELNVVKENEFSAKLSENKNSPYDGIRFFDRNYNESDDFAKFFNSNLHLFKKGKEAAITEEQATTIFKAIGYENADLVEQRKVRIGLDNKDKIVILTKNNNEVQTQKIELTELLDFAKEKANERVIESKKVLQDYLGKEKFMTKDLQDIFISLYEACITQAEEIDSKMQILYDSFAGKDQKQSKSAVLYQRNSYRGWEISADKDFKQSVYVRPFEQTDKRGYILLAGKEGKDGWQEKFVREMLKSNNWTERSALIETLTTFASDKEICNSLGIENSQSLNNFLLSVDKIIRVENDSDIKNELMNYLLDPSENQKVSENRKFSNVSELEVNDKIGKYDVTDVYKISDGVYQATLNEWSDENNPRIGASANYFVIDDTVAKQLSFELKELLTSFNSRSVIENKRYEPYILKDLIEKGLMPPRDSEFVQKLNEHVSLNPLKYEKLKPVNYLNFERKLRQIAEVDKVFNKTPFELGQQLLALVDKNDKEKLNKWLLYEKGCDSRKHMAKVFASWINNTSEQKKDIKKNNNNGYLPRGE